MYRFVKFLVLSVLLVSIAHAEKSLITSPAYVRTLKRLRERYSKLEIQIAESEKRFTLVTRVLAEISRVQEECAMGRADSCTRAVTLLRNTESLRTQHNVDLKEQEERQEALKRLGKEISLFEYHRMGSASTAPRPKK